MAAAAGGAGAAPSLPAPNPRVVLFDLDWTLWQLDVDTHVEEPFTRRPSGEVVDRHGCRIELFPDTRRVLLDLKEKSVTIAFVSRTTDGAAAQALLRALPLHLPPEKEAEARAAASLSLWDLLSSSAYFQAYPGSGSAKKRHFEAIHAASLAPRSEWLFFDDMRDNIEQARREGVISVHLGHEGLTWSRYVEGLQAWRQARRGGSAP